MILNDHIQKKYCKKVYQNVNSFEGQDDHGFTCLLCAFSYLPKYALGENITYVMRINIQ